MAQPNWWPDYLKLSKVIDVAESDPKHRKAIKATIRSVARQKGYIDYREYHPDLQWTLCSTRLQMGDFSDWTGWEYRSDFSMTFNSLQGYRLMKVPYWHGDRVNKLLVLGEQGVGDEILYGSVLPEAIVRLGHKAIEFHCVPRLKDIFERSFRIKCVPRKALDEVPRDADAVVMLADLMRFYRKDASHFPKKPFLKPDPVKVEFWRRELAKLSDKPKVGIAWHSRHGSIDPKDVMQDDFYVNLQYGRETEGAYETGIDPLESMEDQFALVAALDRVVSVTQTVCHVAGAVGTPCDAIIPEKEGEQKGYLWYYGPPHRVYNINVYRLRDYLNNKRTRRTKRVTHRPESSLPGP